MKKAPNPMKNRIAPIILIHTMGATKNRNISMYIIVIPRAQIVP